MIHFLEPYRHSKNKIKVEIDLSKYAKKSDLKSTRGIDPSKFVKKNNLAA